MALDVNKLLETLRCPSCHNSLSAAGDELHCRRCGDLSYQIVDGIPRMLSPWLRHALAGDLAMTGMDAKQVETALSFGYEWNRFPEMYEEWERRFSTTCNRTGRSSFVARRCSTRAVAAVVSLTTRANSQLDRLSAPIENRYTRADVQDWLSRASLESPVVGENFGWVATGRKSE